MIVSFPSFLICRLSGNYGNPLCLCHVVLSHYHMFAAVMLQVKPLPVGVHDQCTCTHAHNVPQSSAVYANFCLISVNLPFPALNKSNH